MRFAADRKQPVTSFPVKLQSREGYGLLHFEGARFTSFQGINYFVTAAEGDIDDSIKRKRICVSLKNLRKIMPFISGEYAAISKSKPFYTFSGITNPKPPCKCPQNVLQSLDLVRPKSI